MTFVPWSPELMSEYLVLRDVLILSSMLISDSCLSDLQMLKLVHNIHTHDIHLILMTYIPKNKGNTNRVNVMVLNATFNNILTISWQSVLLVEETGVPEKKKTDQAQVTDKIDLLKVKVNFGYMIVGLICWMNYMRNIQEMGNR